MKRRVHPIFPIVLLVLVGFVCWRYFSGGPPTQNGLPRTDRTEKPNQNDRPHSKSPGQTAERLRAHDVFHDPIERMQRAADAENVPITFWGKVVDQDGEPLSGVRVTTAVRQLRRGASDFESKFDNHIAFSGSDGRFEVTGVRGDVLTIKSVERDGYRSSPGALRSYGYNISTNHIPRYEQPVLIQMWKVGNPEPLLVHSKFFRFIPDGRQYSVDLLKGIHREGKLEPADIELQLERPSGVARSDRYDWTFRIAVPTGGLIETDDASAYMAPAVGYEKEFSFSVLLTDPIWWGNVTKSFFLTSRNGQIFGALTVDASPYYNGEAAIDLKYTVNPGASRNLEPGGPQLSVERH